MSEKEHQQQAEAQKDSKPEYRRFVPANQETIAQDRPIFYVKRIDLSSQDPFSDVAASLENKLSDQDGKACWYPFLMNREEGVTREQAKELMSQQMESEDLDIVVIPYLVDKCLPESEFSSRSEFREFCAKKVSGSSKELAVAQKYSGVPQFQQLIREVADYTMMHVEMNYMNIGFNKLSRQIEAFLTNATHPVIGYGIPSKIDDASSGRRIQLSDWIPSQEFLMFYEANIPIGGSGSGSDVDWFMPPSDEEVKEIVNLDKAEFPTDEKMKEVFEDYAGELAEKTPREIARNSSLREINRSYVVDNW